MTINVGSCLLHPTFLILWMFNEFIQWDAIPKWETCSTVQLRQGQSLSWRIHFHYSVSLKDKLDLAYEERLHFDLKYQMIGWQCRNGHDIVKNNLCSKGSCPVIHQQRLWCLPGATVTLVWFSIEMHLFPRDRKFAVNMTSFLSPLVPKAGKINQYHRRDSSGLVRK